MLSETVLYDINFYQTESTHNEESSYKLTKF
ncbi:hypothetical protein EMIT0P265_200015 [Pseudomonas zeae]